MVERKGAIGVGVKGAGQIVTFAESAGKAISPGGFGQYEQGKQQIEKATGVSLSDDILAQLDGDLDVSITLNGKFGARADLKDPAAMEKTLAKLRPFIPRIVEGATDGKVGFAKRGPYYAVATAGGTSVVYGVVKERLVVANDPNIAREVADAEATSVPGAKGSVAVKADAEQLGNAMLQQFTGIARPRRRARRSARDEPARPAHRLDRDEHERHQGQAQPVVRLAHD